MSLRTWIEKTRAKPEAQRERIVMLCAICFTVLLFLFWIFDFSMSARSGADVSADTAPSPITILGDNMKAVISNAVDSFKGITGGTTTQEQ